MHMHAPPTALRVPIQVKRAGAGVEGSLKRMVRVSGPAGVQPSAKKIVSPPEVNGANIALDFSVDAATGARVVRILDKETGELIRQVPPEELLQVMTTL